MAFYDDTWHHLLKKYPAIARKIEDLRCDVVLYEQYEEEIKDLKETVKALWGRVQKLEANKHG